MAKKLHITNGDGAGNLIEASELEGDVLPWRDTMFEGPFPAGLDLAQTSRRRAEYLAGVGLPVSEVQRDFEARDDWLARAGEYDEITFWFELDLLDQLQLLQLLDWFAAVDIGATDIGLICIGEFPGIEPFRGLGQLDPARIAALWPRRAPVTDRQLALGVDGWAAFRSDDPRAIETFLDQDTATLPFLAAALHRHLEEFPSAGERVSRTHKQLLRLVGDGVDNPVDLFVQNMELETVFFMGDWSTFRRIGELFSVEEPLLACAPLPVFRWPPEIAAPMDEFRDQRLSLTARGREVLDGGVSAPMRGCDYWLGGVHFENGVASWFWNASEKRLQRAPEG